MDNDATKMMNQNANQNKPQNGMPIPPPLPNAKKTSSHAGAAVAGAAVAGAAMGAGAAMAAGHVYGANADTEEKTSQETQTTQAEVQTTQKAAAEPEVKADTEPPKDHIQPSPAPKPNPVDTDDEVRVVGMAVKDNGDGGVATIIEVQKDGDSALLVDLESDGKIDGLLHDDNGNGTIEDDEIHDISDAEMSTNDMMMAYVQDAHKHGEVATVTNLDTGEKYQIPTTPDDGSVYASNPTESAGGENDGYAGVAGVNDEPVPDDFHTVSDIDPMGNDFAEAGTDDGLIDC